MTGELEIVVEGDRRLFNQYGVMLVNPQKHSDVKKELGQRFIDWLISAEAESDHRLQDQRRAAVLSECIGF
jgi:tungstate transport system substrate-binding protein